MKSVRLTTSMKEAIITSILVHKFGERQKNILEARQTLANECYCEVYSTDVQEKMNSLPHGWLPEETTLRVAFGGEQDSLRM